MPLAIPGDHLDIIICQPICGGISGPVYTIKLTCPEPGSKPQVAIQVNISKSHYPGMDPAMRPIGLELGEDARAVAEGIVVHEGDRLVERVDEVTDEHLASAGGPGSLVGSGGMATKLEAARKLMKAGIPMVVADGRRPDVVVDAAVGRPVGTLFAGGAAAVKGRKLWLAYAGHPRGSVVIDDGAKEALCLRGGSLLPAGVVDVTGSFVVGDPIALVDTVGKELGRGLAGISAEDLKRVRGLRSADIPAVLPGWNGSEVVHRDHLVIF